MVGPTYSKPFHTPEILEYTLRVGRREVDRQNFIRFRLRFPRPDRTDRPTHSDPHHCTHSWHPPSLPMVVARRRLQFQDDLRSREGRR